MPDSRSPRLDRALATLPERYAGPGGAVAVLHNGEVVGERVWGWADAEARLPFTRETPSLVCSITKQFTCALLLDLFPDPSVLDADVRRMLPGLGERAPTTIEMANNQSGMRDYWAQAMLCGAPVEGVFRLADATTLIRRLASLHFAPGTSYSYVNQNFRLLSDLIEERTGQDFATLLRERILAPAGMPRARLNPDTSYVHGGTVGYEKMVAGGFRPAVNRIEWSGDAGLAASLEDMIAWEKAIDAVRDDPDARYNRQARAAYFRNGKRAPYGFGLRQTAVLGRAARGHGGALRGWRAYRCYLPAERASVVVLFNHVSEAHAAGLDLLRALLDLPEPAAQPPVGAGWAGRYLEPQTGLAIRLEPAGADMRLRYGTHPDTLAPTAEGTLSDGTTTVSMAPDGLWFDRGDEDLRSRLVPAEGAPAPDIEGSFHCAELSAALDIAAAGGVLYGAFRGLLGRGEMHELLPYARDIWLLPCPRALDDSAPGDWTLRVMRDGGRVSGVMVGCWLARNLPFLRA